MYQGVRPAVVHLMYTHKHAVVATAVHCQDTSRWELQRAVSHHHDLTHVPVHGCTYKSINSWSVYLQQCSKGFPVSSVELLEVCWPARHLC